MTQIEKRDIIVDVSKATWGNPTATIESVHQMVTPHEEIEEFLAYCKQLQTTNAVLLPEEKVLFHETARFPRKKFRENFKENPVVISAEKCDAVIIDLLRVLNKQYIWAYSYWHCNNGHYTRDKGCSTIIPGSAEVKFMILDPYRDKMVDYYNEVYRITEGKKVVDVKNLNLPSQEELDIMAYTRIDRMFSGNDSAMLNLAMNLLTAYDYDKEKYKINALLSLRWDNWVRSRDKKTNVEIKSLLRKLELDFPATYGGYRSRLNDTKFWMEMSVTHPDDEVMNAAFMNWVRTFYEDAPNFRIVKS